MDRKRDIESGSASLAIILATVLTMSIVSAYTSFTEYLTVVNAIDEGIRSSARCLTPTDGECVESSFNEQSATAHWHGVSNDLQSQFLIDRYKYDAFFVETSWQALFNVYRVTRVNPYVSVSGYQLPTIDYKPVTNEFENRYAKVNKSWNEVVYRPESAPSFPSFTYLNELFTDRQSPEEYWNQLGSISSGFKEAGLTINFTDRQQILLPGSVVEVKSEKIHIPVIRKELDCHKLEQCNSVNDLAGRPDSDIDFRDSAFIAIKVFANFESLGQKSMLRWGDGSQNGLYLDAWSQQGQKIVHKHPLGGRTYTEVSQDASWINLWLRGPDGAHGGDDKKEYSSLIVPRGGSFQITGFIKSSASYDAAQINDIKIYYYFNNYLEESILHAEQCDEIQLQPTDSKGLEIISGGNEILSISCPEDCAKNISLTDSICSPDLSTLRIEPLCERGPLSFVSNAQAAEFQTFAVCDDSLPDIKINENQTICGWEQKESKQLFVVSQLNESCHNASLFSGELPCFNDPNKMPFKSSSIVNLNAFECEAVNTLLQNSLEIPVLAESDPTFEAITSNDTELIADKYKNKTTYTYKVDQFIPEDAVEKVEMLSPPVSGYVLNNQQTPDIEGFNFDIYEDNRKYSPDDILSVSVEKIYEVSGSRKETSIDNVYPFKSNKDSQGVELGEYEIGRSYQYSVVCNREKHYISEDCNQHESLESILREFAIQEYPQLNNKNIKLFVKTPRLIATEVFPDKSSALQINGINVCTPVMQICDSKPLIDYLGEFAIESYPRGPDVCNNGDYQQCYSSRASSHVQISDPYINHNYTQAEARILESISRHYPTARFHCLDEGCFNFTLDSLSTDDVKINISYKLPLSWPLSYFFKNGSMEIHRSTSSARELAMLNAEEVQ